MTSNHSQSYKNRARGVLSSRQDAHQVANFVSLTFPDKLKQRKRKRRRHTRNSGYLGDFSDQMAPNEGCADRSFQSSKRPQTYPPLFSLRRERVPTQHSLLCFQNCNWLFARDRDPLETNRTLQSTNDELENTWCWRAAWNSHIKVYYEIAKLHRNFFDGELMIRDQWGPLEGQEIRFVQRGAVDSNSWHHTRSRYLTPDMSSKDESSPVEDVHPDDPNSDETHTCQIVCSPRNILNSKSRSQWLFLDVMCPSDFDSWRLMNDRDIKSWDTRRGSGNMMHNDESRDSDIWSSNSLARFLTTTCDLWPGYAFKLYYVEEELSARMKLASMFASIMKTDITTTHCLERPLSPSPVAPCNHLVFSDVVATPNEAVLPWDYGDPIVLFAAQYRSGDPSDAITQLAYSLQSGINILILYYLETRHDINQSLPNWMYLYGIVYSESEIRIYTHYPLFQPELSTSSYGSGWSARSTPVEIDLDDIFDRQAYERSTAVTALLRIQSHIRFIVNRLRLWDGFHRMTQLLDASTAKKLID